MGNSLALVRAQALHDFLGGGIRQPRGSLAVRRRSRMRDSGRRLVPGHGQSSGGGVMMWRASSAVVLALALGAGAMASPESGGPEAAPARPKFEIEHDTQRVVRHDPSGKARWSTRLDGYLGLVRPPHLLWDARRVYVTHGDGVTALDAGTGKVLWHAKGPNDRLRLSGGLLLAADCKSGEGVVARGRWLTARAVTTGAEVFRVRLPTKDFDPLPIRELAGLFLVQVTEEPGGKGAALLIDRKGEVRHRLDREVVDGKRQGQDLMLLTSRDVVRVSPDGRTRWAARFPRREWIAGGQLVELAGGDLVAYLYGRINDSGVQVVRLEPATGKKAWKVRCAPLGVLHSEYEHRVNATVEGNRLKVTSRGSGGTFVELLDLKSGRQLKRTRTSGDEGPTPRPH